MANEFEIISKYFHPLSKIGKTDIFEVGQGDDCAVVKPNGRSMAFSIDTQVSNVHFYADMPANLIATRGLAAALSDLAAMGAEPAFFTLALSLPDHFDDQWIESYTKGLTALATKWSIPLMGGDTTRSTELVQTFQVHGYLDHAPMTRKQAKPGDIVAVTGNLGDAAAAIELINQGIQPSNQLLNAYNHPEPQFILSRKLSPWATACIDISDGLLADLGHICTQSQCGADIQIDQIPTSESFQLAIPSIENRYLLSAAGGDDYHLCFTVDEKHWHNVKDLPITAIGRITQGNQVNCYNQAGDPIILSRTGFQHRQNDR